MEDTEQLYLDLMKRALTYLIYGQEEFMPAQRPRDFVRRFVFDALGKRGIVPMRRLPVNLENRIEGRDWPAVGLTMIGMKRLNQLQECVEDVLADNVPGDFIEAGTWRGGAAIFLRAILKAHRVNDRNVLVADSFEGLPSPLPVLATHEDRVESLPTGGVLLAGNDSAPIQAFRVGESVWGVQFHPEATPGILRDLILQRRRVLEEDARAHGLPAEGHVERLLDLLERFEPGPARRMLDNFVRLCLRDREPGRTM